MYIYTYNHVQMQIYSFLQSYIYIYTWYHTIMYIYTISYDHLCINTYVYCIYLYIYITYTYTYLCIYIYMYIRTVYIYIWYSISWSLLSPGFPDSCAFPAPWAWCDRWLPATLGWSPSDPHPSYQRCRRERRESPEFRVPGRCGEWFVESTGIFLMSWKCLWWMSKKPLVN